MKKHYTEEQVIEAIKQYKASAKATQPLSTSTNNALRQRLRCRWYHNIHATAIRC
jgi:hypothetical protein